MAKIIKIGSVTDTPKLAGSIKTVRKSTTNPFSNSNFEGNTLQFADIFEGFEPKSTSKLRMIASSVAGSMNKFKSSITEPIVNFVKRVSGGISSAWDYAVNTNIKDIPGIKQVNNVLNTPINLPRVSDIPGLKQVNEILNTPICLPESITAPFAGLKAGIKGKIGALTGLGKDVSSAIDVLKAKMGHKKISAETPVSELEAMWKDIIALNHSEAA